MHLRTFEGYSLEYGWAIKGGMELKINLAEDSITFSPLNKNQIEIVKNALEEKVRIDYKTVYEYYYRKQIDDEPPQYLSLKSENKGANSAENLAQHDKLISAGFAYYYPHLHSIPANATNIILFQGNEQFDKNKNCEFTQITKGHVNEGRYTLKYTNIDKTAIENNIVDTYYYITRSQDNARSTTDRITAIIHLYAWDKIKEYKKKSTFTFFEEEILGYKNKRAEQ